MSLKTQIASDVATVFLNTDEHAETVTYTPSGGSATSVSAIVQRQEPLRQEMDDGISDHYHARIRVASAVVTSPSVNDVFTFDGVDWSVDAPPLDDAFGLVTFVVYRRVQLEDAGAGHRLPSG